MAKDHLIGKLDTHPYGVLLRFAADRTLEQKPFKKEEAISKGVTSEEFDLYAPFILEARNGEYVVTFKPLQDFLSYADMARTKKNADVALGVAILSILLALILGALPLLKKDNPIELGAGQFEQLVKAAEQPVKLADSPVSIKIEETQFAELTPKNKVSSPPKEPSLFPPKKQVTTH